MTVIFPFGATKQKQTLNIPRRGEWVDLLHPHHFAVIKMNRLVAVSHQNSLNARP